MMQRTQTYMQKIVKPHQRKTLLLEDCLENEKTSHRLEQNTATAKYIKKKTLKFNIKKKKKQQKMGIRF